MDEEIKKLITENGLLVNGIGTLLNKMDKLIELTDRTNFLLSMVEKKMEKIINIA